MNNLLSMLLYNSYKFHLSAPILLYFWALHPTCLRRNFSYSRWWDQRVVIRRVSRMRVVADRSSRHPHHQVLRKSWPPRLSCFANLSKGSSEVDTMPINLKLLVIRISCNSASSVPQDRRTTGCGCLDSHNRVQVCTTSGAMFGGK